MKNYFKDKSNEFLESNKISIGTCNKIESFLENMGLFSLITIINLLSINLKIPNTYRQRNTFYIFKVNPIPTIISTIW